MKSLARSARRVQEDSGQFLPTVLRPLEEAKIRARSGTATFVAGPPGAMKTGLVLYLVLRMNLPTLYFSADAEDFEVVERAGAAISGDTMEQVRANPERYVETLRTAADNVRFVYEDSPTYEDVELEIAAYAEVYGEFPKVIVIDNLMNVVGEQENEWGSMRDTARVIHRLTRITKAGLFVLHHMADDRNDPSTPAPRAKLQGKVGQLPKAIWSLALNGDKLLICPAKNRWGPADASGQTYVTVYVDPARNRLYNSWADLQAGVPA
jgi:RecA-family ATPase